jgi:hypothetical protein
MTTKKKVFMSFDSEHDEDAKIMLAEQARLPDSPFDITDASERAPLTDDWGDKVRRRMDNIDVVIVICGEDAYLAKGVAAEVTIAQEKNTGPAQGQHQPCHPTRSTNGPGTI